MKKLFESWREYLLENSPVIFLKKQMEEMGQEIMSQFDIDQNMSSMKVMEQQYGVVLLINLAFAGDFISMTGYDIPGSAFSITTTLASEGEQYKISYQIMEVKPGPKIFHIGQGVYAFELFGDIKDRIVSEIIQIIEEKL